MTAPEAKPKKAAGSQQHYTGNMLKERSFDESSEASFKSLQLHLCG